MDKSEYRVNLVHDYLTKLSLTDEIKRYFLGRNILVTGGFGFIGSNFILKFINNDNINILYNFGYLFSSIDTYSSTIISGDFSLSYKDIKKQVTVAFKNFGYIIDSYTNNEIDLPTLIHLTFLKIYTPILIQLNYEKRLDINQETYSLSSKNNSFVSNITAEEKPEPISIIFLGAYCLIIEYKKIASV